MARSCECDPKTRSTDVAVHFDAPDDRSLPSYAPSVDTDVVQSVPPSSRLTKKSFVSTPGRSVSTPCVEPPWFAPSTRRPALATLARRPPVVRPEHAQASPEGGHLGRRQREQVGLVEQPLLGLQLVARPPVVPEAVGDRLEDLERLDVGVLLRRVGAPG